MTKVYCVFFLTWDGPELKSIYLTKESAEKGLEKAKSAIKDRYYHQFLDIEEWEVHD